MVTKMSKSCRILSTVLIVLVSAANGNDKRKPDGASIDKVQLLSPNGRHKIYSKSLRILSGSKCYAEVPKGKRAKSVVFKTEKECQNAAAKNRKRRAPKNENKTSTRSIKYTSNNEKSKVFIFTADSSKICQAISWDTFQARFRNAAYYGTKRECLNLYDPKAATVFYPVGKSCESILLGHIDDYNKRRNNRKKIPSYTNKDECIKRHFLHDDKEAFYFDLANEKCAKISVRSAKEKKLQYYDKYEACNNAHKLKYYYSSKLSIACTKTYLTEADLKRTNEFKYFSDKTSCEKSLKNKPVKRLSLEIPDKLQKQIFGKSRKLRRSNGEDVLIPLANTNILCGFEEGDVCLASRDIVRKIEDTILGNVPHIVDLKKAWDLYSRLTSIYTIDSLMEMFNKQMQKLDDNPYNAAFVSVALISMAEVVQSNRTCNFLLRELPVRHDFFVPIKKPCSELDESNYDYVGKGN